MQIPMDPKFGINNIYISHSPSFAVDGDIHTATGCYASVETLELECFFDLVINIVSNEFGLSKCPGNNSCCPAPDDCIIPGSPERLEEINKARVPWQ